MAGTIRCTIVTPDDAVFDEEVRYVSFPAWDGQHGAMQGQSPLLTRLGIGGLRLDLSAGGARWFWVDAGFAQMTRGVLTILTERALPSDALSAEKAGKDLAEANARAVTGGDDQRTVEAGQQRARTQRQLALETAGRHGA